MINQFRRLNPVNMLLLIIIAVVIRIGMFVQLPDMIEFDLAEPYASYWIETDASTLFSASSNVFFALIITLIQAIIFNRVINNYNLLGKPSFLPALMYVTGSSILLPFLVLSPSLLCNFLVIWVIDKVLSMHRKQEARSVMYDCGMIIGLGSLLYFPFVVMIPLLWIALTIFRPFDWREWVAGLIGFATIYFFLGVAYYLTGFFEQFSEQQVPLAKTFPQAFKVNWYDYIVLIPLLLIIVLSIVSLQQKLYRSNVHIRKSYLVLFFLLIFGLLSFYLKPEYHTYHFLIAVPPTAVFMSHYFMNAGKRWFYEGLYFLLLGFIVYFQFF